MTTYFIKSEIESSIKKITADYVKDCINNKRISEDFLDLIKYNFSAKYVSYNNAENEIEIGVEDANPETSHYPIIKVVTFLITRKRNQWLEESFKNETNDLVFYGRLINRKKYNHKNAEVIVM